MKTKRGKSSRSGARTAPPVVLEGRVRDVTDVGDAVVETERGIVMVSGALPGELVRLRTQHARGGVLHGELTAVLEPSPARIEPECPIAVRCGGCPLMSLALPAQHELKRRRVERAVAGVCGDGVGVEFEAIGAALGYRQRARFSFRRLGSGLLLGYHAHASHHVVDVERCAVLTPALASALARVRSLLGPELSGSGSIDLDGHAGARVDVAVRCDDVLAPSAYRAAEQLAGTDSIASVAVAVGDGAAARFGEPTRAQLGKDGRPVVSPRHGFTQVNAAVNVRLGELALALAEPEGQRVLELYSGHGNFTLELARRASALVAVEGDAKAANACRDNLRARDVTSARVLCSDVRELKLRESFDVLVLDPPRGGCPNLALLAQHARPSRVVYISCHMTTLQRDLRALHAQGYEADRVHALDMFPQTGHVEAVVRMRQVSGAQRAATKS